MNAYRPIVGAVVLAIILAASAAHLQAMWQVALACVLVIAGAVVAGLRVPMIRNWLRHETSDCCRIDCSTRPGRRCLIGLGASPDGTGALSGDRCIPGANRLTQARQGYPYRGRVRRLFPIPCSTVSTAVEIGRSDLRSGTNLSHPIWFRGSVAMRSLESGRLLAKLSSVVMRPAGRPSARRPDRPAAARFSQERSG